MNILVCNGAHIGDIILTTSVLPPLRKAFPGSKIGLLVGSWALDAVLDHKLVDAIHILDQSSLNRKQQRKKDKKKRESETWHLAMDEVKATHYDVALDLYTFYKKNAGHFLYQSGIEERVAYWGSLTPFFYNHFLFWDWKDFHMVDNFRMFLTEWGVAPLMTEGMAPFLDYHSLPPFAIPFPEREYIVIHVGVGDPTRAWPFERWKELASLLPSLKQPIIFAGQGASEGKLAEELTSKIPGAISLCNKITWKELYLLIKNAGLVLGLESMAGHMAAATDTPAVLIYGGHVPIHRWRPFNAKCQLITPLDKYFHPTKKRAPLFAIQTISAQRVFEKIEALKK